MTESLENQEVLAENPRVSRNKATSVRGLDMLISGVIASIFFLVPVFFTGQVAQGLAFEKSIIFYLLTLVGLVAWVMKGVVSGELTLRRTPLDIPALLLLVVYLASTVLSVNVKDSLVGAYSLNVKGFLTLLVYIAFYYLVINNVNAQKARLYFASFVSSVILISLYSVLQLNAIYLLPADFAKQRIYNPLGSLSALAAFLSISLPLLSVAVAQGSDLFKDTDRYLVYAWRALSGLGLLAAIVSLAILNGYAFWPAAIIGMVILVMFYLSKVIKVSTASFAAPLMVFFALVILFVMGNFKFRADLEPLPGEVSLSRKASWNIAYNSLKEDPFFGSGPSTFAYSFAQYRNKDFNQLPLWNFRFDSSAGLVLEKLATVGVLGTLAFAVFVLVGLSLVFLSILRYASERNAPMVLAFLAASVVSLIQLSLFSSNNTVVLFVALMGVLAVAVSLDLYADKIKNYRFSFRSSPNYALALSAIFLTVSASVVVIFTMGIKMYLADVYARKAIGESNLDTQVNYYNNALKLVDYQDRYYMLMANVQMSLANQAAANGEGETRIAGFLRQAIDSGLKALSLTPNSAVANEEMALIYENAAFYTRGALDSAEKYYLEEARLDPNNPVPYLRIALIKMAASNAESNEDEKKLLVEEAIRRYDEAINLKQNWAAAYYGRGIAYERLGKLDEAITELKNANMYLSTENNSQANVDYVFELGRLHFNRGVTSLALSQSATKQIAENEGGQANSALSVDSNGSAARVTSNEDLNNAEQYFSYVLSQVPLHANALYSRAVLYQKTGKKVEARLDAEKLIYEVMQEDEQTKNALKEQFKEVL